MWFFVSITPILVIIACTAFWMDAFYNPPPSSDDRARTALEEAGLAHAEIQLFFDKEPLSEHLLDVAFRTGDRNVLSVVAKNPSLTRAYRDLLIRISFAIKNGEYLRRDLIGNPALTEEEKAFFRHYESYKPNLEALGKADPK